MKSPWTQALAVPTSDAQLADRVRMAAQPVADLQMLEPGVGGPLLQNAFKTFYEPSAQDLKIIREIVSAGAAYACQAYPSIEHYKQTADRRINASSETAARMLTGHSGVGKSALLAAVRRLLPAELELDAGPDLARFPMVLAAHVRMYSKISASELLVALAECAGLQMEAERSSGAVLRWLRQRLYQRSVNRPGIHGGQLV